MIGYQKAPLLIGMTPQLVMSEPQKRAGRVRVEPRPILLRVFRCESEASFDQRSLMCEMSCSLLSRWKRATDSALAGTLAE